MKEDGRGLAAWPDGDVAATPVLRPAPSVTDTTGPVGVLSAEEGSVPATPRDAPSPAQAALRGPGRPPRTPGNAVPPAAAVTPSAQGLLSGAHESPGPYAQSQSRYPPALPPALVPRGGSEGTPTLRSSRSTQRPGGSCPQPRAGAGPVDGSTRSSEASGQVTNNVARSKCAKGAGTTVQQRFRKTRPP